MCLWMDVRRREGESNMYIKEWWHAAWRTSSERGEGSMASHVKEELLGISRGQGLPCLASDILKCVNLWLYVYGTKVD